MIWLFCDRCGNAFCTFRITLLCQNCAYEQLKCERLTIRVRGVYPAVLEVGNSGVERGLV